MAAVLPLSVANGAREGNVHSKHNKLVDRGTALVPHVSASQENLSRGNLYSFKGTPQAWRNAHYLRAVPKCKESRNNVHAAFVRPRAKRCC